MSECIYLSPNRILGIWYDTKLGVIIAQALPRRSSLSLCKTTAVHRGYKWHSLALSQSWLQIQALQMSLCWYSAWIHSERTACAWGRLVWFGWWVGLRTSGWSQTPMKWYWGQEPCSKPLFSLHLEWGSVDMFGFGKHTGMNTLFLFVQ